MKELAFSELWYWFLLMAVVCYFVGCVNFAAIYSRAHKRDVHKMGSGNPGSMNMTREFGLKVGFCNFIVDFCKGGVPALVSFFIFRGYYFAGTEVVVSDFTRYFCGLFVVLGHIWPVTMKFRGGKGIASTLGLLSFGLGCENPWYIFAAVGALLIVLVYIISTEWGSMGSLLGVTGLSVWQGILLFLRYSADIAQGWVIGIYLLLLGLNFLTWFAHRKNLLRLLAGEEHRTSVKKLSKGKRGTQNM